MSVKRKRFFYNMNTCIGCGACQVACKDHHGLMPGEYYRRVSLQTVQTEAGEVQVPLSISCNHCEEPACVAACPTTAMHQQEDGVVLHDDDLCIGCGRCYWACPYGEVSFSQSRGMTQKCDTCPQLRSQGKPTACVAACPTSSLWFGELPEDQGEALDLPFLPSSQLTRPTTTIQKAQALEEKRHD